MDLERSVPLAPWTTLRIGGSAARVAVVETEAHVPEALRAAEAESLPVFVLGGGSNVVVADEGFAGVAIRMASRGVEVERDGARVVVHVAAGEPWEPFVERCVAEGWGGVESLSGIPGLVGATPIQNVGAYGHEVKETIRRVRVFDRVAKSFVEMDAAACGFAYRSSVFRETDRFVVVRVTFALAAGAKDASVRYAELARALGVHEGERAPIAEVRRTVIALRRGKGMVLDAADPDSVSAGSFFVNPTLSREAFAALERRVADAKVLRADERMPRYAAGDCWKVSAAWLVERAGFLKGYGEGRVGVSRKHSLALVNRGSGTARELLALAREIRDGVEAKFGVRLSAEPVMIGCAL